MSEVEKDKENFDTHVKSWLTSLKTASPDDITFGVSDLTFNKAPRSLRSESTISSTKSDRKRSMVKPKLAAHANNQETQKVHETRSRARKRAEELKRKAREAMELELRRVEEELREVEEETEASLRERQRELELAEVEAKAWEEVERDSIVLEDSLSNKLSSVPNISACMYAEPGPSTHCLDDSARTQPNPDPEDPVFVNRCTASVSRQSKMVPPSMPSSNASHPTSCSQEALWLLANYQAMCFHCKFRMSRIPITACLSFNEKNRHPILEPRRGMLLGKK